MKKFILGLIIGIMTTFSLSVYAAVELNVIENPFPILINGQASEVEGYNINGFTYLKMADLKDTGLTVIFNETDKQIEITSAATDISTTSTKSISTGGASVSLSELNEITETPDGITRIDTWEGKQYISYSAIQNALQPKGYDLIHYVKEISDPDTGVIIENVKKWQLIKGTYNSYPEAVNDYEVLIDDVPTTMAYGHSSVELNYYIDTVLPLIQ